MNHGEKSVSTLSKLTNPAGLFLLVYIISTEIADEQDDKLICWYPPHLNSHTQPCLTDPTPCPANAHLFQPKLVAAVLLKDRSREDGRGIEIVLQSGRQERHFKATSGFNLVEMALSPGKQQAKVSRNGHIILKAEGDMDVTETPQGIWNYNPYVMKLSRHP
jgi:hypothetical protein